MADPPPAGAGAGAGAGLPKLQAVARAAGVSVSTVSKVLNGRPDVAPATRTRVAEALGRAGYPEVGGRRSGAGKAGKAGKLVEVVANRLDDVVTAHLLRSVCLEAYTRDIGVIVTDAESAHGRAGRHPPRRWLEAMDARGTGAVISLLMDFSEAQLAYFEAHEVTACVVGMDELDPGLLDAAAVPSLEAMARVALDLVASDYQGAGSIAVPPWRVARGSTAPPRPPA